VREIGGSVKLGSVDDIDSVLNRDTARAEESKFSEKKATRNTAEGQMA
jgi:hypothetical protein